ncbi:MAG TPA: cation:proton antiporter [Longimicrobiales bacterium]|nr:cation:proton antiporter [Longimicrobiales bacterium]
MSAPTKSTPRRGGPSGTLRPGVMLVLLFGLTWLSFQGLVPTLEGGRLSVLVGFVLLASSVSGVLAAEVGLPRITGYIVVGIVAGPSLLGLLPAPAVEDLSLIDDFALALIAMLAGGELQVGSLRPQARSIALVTLTVTSVVWVGVALVLLGVRPFVPFLAALPLTAAVGVALLLGVWAANSSPDLTVAVIEEKGAKGTLVDVILGVTIVKDVVVIVLFTLTLTLVTPLLDPSQAFSGAALVDLVREVGGALVVGAAGGWVFSQYLGKEGDRARSPLATFLFAYMIVVVSAELHVELLLTGVAAGFVIENLSPAGDRMIQGIRSVAVVIFAFFFAIAGAGLDLGSVLRFGPAALVLLGARVLLTRFGTRHALRWAGASDVVRERAWLGLISQGGVSLGLVLLIRDAFPDLGGGVVALAMAVIIGNILGGPILLGRALVPPKAEPGGGA